MSPMVWHFKNGKETVNHIVYLAYKTAGEIVSFCVDVIQYSIITGANFYVYICT